MVGCRGVRGELNAVGAEFSERGLRGEGETKDPSGVAGGDGCHEDGEVGLKEIEIINEGLSWSCDCGWLNGGGHGHMVVGVVVVVVIKKSGAHMS
jgi:hypothetical protein